MTPWATFTDEQGIRPEVDAALIREALHPPYWMGVLFAGLLSYCLVAIGVSGMLPW